MGPLSRVSYFYDPEIGNYHFGLGHPMKPHRVRMTHNLVVNYGLYRKLQVFRPRLVSPVSMTRFHSDDYINFLRRIAPDNMQEHIPQLQRFNLGEDCPVFDGLFDYCQLYTSGSLGGADRINQNLTDIVINWAGGMHNPKASEASGFGYVNDCVLAILELLKKHKRVLYIDMDLHHGDGVEEAFFSTNRVMTVSFHAKFGGMFPGSGDASDIGYKEGKNYAINVPLEEGVDDDSYRGIFQSVIAKAMEVFAPDAVVLQCGANTLSGDRLGCFNLSVRGHGECVKFVKSFGIPMLVLGGGGYSLRNVPRCWTYETALLTGEEIKDELPFNDYFEYYGPDYRLHIRPSNMSNQNTTEHLNKIKSQVMDIFREIEAVPGTQIQTGQVQSQLNPGFGMGTGENYEEPSNEDGTAVSAVQQEHPAELAA